MRTNKTKDEFVKEMTVRINMCEQLKIFYKDYYLPTLKKFDGKVYNIRFIKTLREKANEFNKNIYISELKNGDTIEIEIRKSQFSYTDYEFLSIYLHLNDDNRIQYEESVNHKLSTAWLDNFDNDQKEFQLSINHYDEYLALTTALEDMINAYSKLPYQFRRNMSTDHLKIYL